LLSKTSVFHCFSFTHTSQQNTAIMVSAESKCCCYAITHPAGAAQAPCMQASKPSERRITANNASLLVDTRIFVLPNGDCTTRLARTCPILTMQRADRFFHSSTNT
jgi:hypothetical protein